MVETNGRWIPLVLLLATAAACGLNPAVERQRSRLELEQQARMETLQRIEARLLDARARSREWEELRNRHEQVSAIACENVAEHVAGMEKLQALQVEKRRRLEASRVAQAPRLDATRAGRRPSGEIPTAEN